MSAITVDRATLFSRLPDRLRQALLDRFNEIIRNFRERRWEPSELNAGKFCEVVYSILMGYIDGAFPSSARKPKNFVDACRKLEHASASSFSRSVRVQIPRMLIALYEIRNNRGVGHVGGDVEPNHMDSVAVLYMSKWILAELIRIFHDMETGQAADAVDTVMERILPAIWKVGEDMYRVLKTNLSMKEKTLMLLYQTHEAVSEKMLISWTEYSNPSVYRRDVLRRLHAHRLIEFNETERTARISPIGIRYVEEEIELVC